MASDKHRRVLIAAPTGCDAQLLREMLAKNGTVCEIFDDVCQLCEELRNGCGTILLTEEALGPGALECLSNALSAQPNWSDVPVIVLTSNWPKMEAAARLMFRQQGIRGSFLSLEKPVRPLSLRSTVDAALMTRARQYEMRDYLDQRSRSEESLRKAHETLEMILNNIPDRFFAVDKEWRISGFNQHAEEQLRRLGKDPANMIGAVLWDEFPSPPIEDIFRRAMSERVAITHEHYYPPLGEWVENSIYPSPDGGLAIFQRYITERKQAEMALRESEERYRLLVEGVRDYAIYMLDVGGHVASWNQAAERIKGYKADEIIGEHFSRFYSTQDVKSGKPQLHLRQAASEGHCEDEGWRIRKDGTRFWANVVITALKDQDGGIRGFSKIVRDITERRLAELDLRRSEGYLAEAQRLSHTGTWAWDVSSGELFWSDEHFRIFGLAPGSTEPTYEMFFHMVCPEDRSRLRQMFERNVGEKSDFDAEYRIIRPDGTIRFINSLGHPVFTESGDITEYVGTAIDLTERRHAEEALQKAQAELAYVARVTTMGELAAAIAHEVNQPLGAIVNNAYVCLRLAATGSATARADLHEALSDIVKDAQRASAIIARIRGLMKRNAPEKKRLPVDDLIRAVLALADREIAEHRIAVRIEVSNESPTAVGDHVQLQQVLFNLVMNAIAAMSSVEISRRVLTIRVHGAALNGRPAVQIAVHDLGCGFRKEEAEYLFESFYTTKPDGLGMGLSISRSIVEAHGGRLWAQANEDAGATFLFSLPIESP